jgi:viroplasmin and RNaseH domain-containing protein
VKGSDKSYIAYSPSKNRLIYVQQLWSPDEQKVKWLVGATRQSFEDLEEAKEFAKEILND